MLVLVYKMDPPIYYMQKNMEDECFKSIEEIYPPEHSHKVLEDLKISVN